MKAKLAALALALLIGVSGCAKSDWIDRTLVTVDVTGTWCRLGDEGMCLQLEQTGATAKGFIHLKGGTLGANTVAVPAGRITPLEGYVSGDVFSFAQTSGQIRGRLTVSGDEMAGEILTPVRRSIVLRRVDPSKLQDLDR